MKKTLSASRIMLPLLIALVWGNYSHSAFSGIEWRSLAGEQVTLEQHRGKVVVLNFWATWCQPCLGQLKLLNDLRPRYDSNAVLFVGVSKDTAEALQELPQFIQKKKIKLPVWTGATDSDQQKFRLAEFIPVTAILDAQGNLAFRIVGQAAAQDIDERINWLLSDSSVKPPSELILPAGLTYEHFRAHELGLEEEHSPEEEIAVVGSEVPS
jgi:thiol-disulfide isomerase/thioredoxin